jgi:hypothetical protein
MAFGEMRCLGNQIHLKNRFGLGYNLQTNFELSKDEELCALLHKAFPGIHEIAKFDGFREFRIGVDAGLRVSDIFERMSTLSRENRWITDWNITQVSLDDIFQHVVETSHKEKDSVQVHVQMDNPETIN